jgi:hypothetical protein
MATANSPRGAWILTSFCLKACPLALTISFLFTVPDQPSREDISARAWDSASANRQLSGILATC